MAFPRGAFDLAGRTGGREVVAGVFGDHRPALALGLPVRRPVIGQGDQVAYLRAGVFRRRDGGSLAWLGSLVGQRWQRQVRRRDGVRQGQ